jgi:hypothetical protein
MTVQTSGDLRNRNYSISVRPPLLAYAVHIRLPYAESDYRYQSANFCNLVRRRRCQPYHKKTVMVLRGRRSCSSRRLDVSMS